MLIALNRQAPPSTSVLGVVPVVATGVEAALVVASGAASIDEHAVANINTTDAARSGVVLVLFMWLLLVLVCARTG
jgi:hypothetical protein